MKVRIKSAGWLTLGGVCFIILSVVMGARIRASVQNHKLEIGSFAETGVNRHQVVSSAPTITDKAIIAAASPTMRDGGFEDGYADVGAPLDGQPAVVKGSLPEGWFDQSRWADLDVTYAEDDSSPHGGKASLRIDVGDIRSQSVVVVQPLKVTGGTTYTAAVWLRASKSCSVQFGLRMRGKPYKFYGQTMATVGTSWQQVTVKAKVDETHPQSIAYFLIDVDSPQTSVWVDDATFGPAS
jgi:hypothetical protein